MPAIHLLRPILQRLQRSTVAGGAAAFVLIVCATLIGMDVWSSVNSHEAAIRSAESTTLNLARSLAQHADGILRTTDVVLYDLRERLEAPGGHGAAALERTDRMLQDRVRDLPFLRRLAVLDAGGQILLASGVPQALTNASSVLFRYHAGSPDPRPFIGPPLLLPDRRWVFTLSRRISHPDGSFNGVVVAALDIAYFNHFYDGFDIGRAGVVTLATGDGMLLTRRPQAESHIGTSLRNSPVWDVLDSGTSTGFGAARSRIDNVERLTSFVRLPSYDLVVFAGLAREDVFADWWAATYWQLVAALLLSASLGFAGLWLVHQIRVRMRAEVALQASELRWKYAIEGVGDGLWDWNNRNGEVHYSRQWKAMLGYREDEIDGGIDERERLIHPDDRGPARKAYLDYAAGHSPAYAIELRMLARDGSWRWILSRGMIVERDADGRPLRTIGTHSDITERKNMERALRLSEQRFRLLVEEVRDYAIFLLDSAGHVVTWNKGAQRITGYAEEDIVGRHYAQFFTPEDVAHGKPLAALVLAAQAGRHTDEGWRVRKNGSRFWAHASLAMVTNDAGRLIGYAKVVRDVTDSRRLETQLRESEAFVRATLDALPVEICVLSRDGVIIAVNQAWRDFCRRHLPAAPLHGLGQRYVVLCAADAALLEESVREVETRIVRTLRGECDSFTVEYPCNSSHGQHWFRLQGARFSAESGGGRGQIVLAHENITEVKLAELDLKFSATVYRALGEAILVLDPRDRVMAINPAFTKLTGLLEPAAHGRPLGELLVQGQDEEMLHQLASQVAKTGRWQGQVMVRHAQGVPVHSWLMIDTIFDEADRPRQRVAMFSKVTDHKLAAQTIWEQANFDPLTGLPNRSMFHDRLDHEVKKSRRTGLPLALMFIDLDRFKDINDTLGHDVGDILLQETARRLLSCVRDADTVARLGGDEFTVILGELSSTAIAARIADDILARLAEPFALGQELAYISASVGITHYPQDTDRIDALIKNADQAMYAAKAGGRNRYAYFTASMQEAAHARRRIINDLRTAIGERQFCVAYQPIVTLASGRVHKAEALIRWDHPQRGLVSPADFIGVAEESGLIFDIGNWVFAEVARQVRDWRRQHGAPLQVSVNLSPAQFRQDREHEKGWLATLQALGVPGHCLGIEITEGTMMEPSMQVSAELHRLRDAGLQVSLDDFGTGYSALSYLKKFDIDTLKIDQSFVRNMTPGSDDLALCEAIIVMAHKLGIEVVAEGVETREQRNMLVAAGCDYGQGYYFATPLAPDDFAALWRGDLVAAPA